MEIYTTESKEVEDSCLSVASDNLDQNHHLYQESYCNSEGSRGPLGKENESFWYSTSEQRTSIRTDLLREERSVEERSVHISKEE
jgi:hypothetical protein